MRHTAIAAAALLLAAPAAEARDLVFARGTEQISIDPHYNNAGNDVSTNQDIYERLFEMDAKQVMRPGLALSWKALDPLRWEIRLRPGVTFQDGQPFSAEDVAFSLDRPNRVVSAAAP
jgi:peptide/nickel transport system substrate-binding protein